MVSTSIVFHIIDEPAVQIDVAVKGKISGKGLKDRPIDDRELTEEEWKTLLDLPLRDSLKSILEYFRSNKNKPIRSGDFPRATGSTDYYQLNTTLKREFGVPFAVRAVPSCKVKFCDRLIKLYPLK